MLAAEEIRSMLKHSWILLALAGCIDEPLDLHVNHQGASATVYDDGTNLVVTGCSDGGFLGCNSPAFGVAMTATVGGVVMDVPQSTAGSIPDQLLGLFGDGPFQLAVAAPADGQLGLALAGAATTVALPPAFAVTAGPTHVARATGPITITHEVWDGGTTQALVITTCGARQRTDLVEETTAGQLELPFDAFSAADGACSHEIHVDQSIGLDSPTLAVTAIRIERVTVTSEP
jgi:hypothetical protein